MQLATFLHISDLHFGSIDAKTGLRTYDATAPQIWSNLEWFDGLLGHSYRSLMALEKFYSTLLQNERTRLIVTGDLTTVGHGEQFDTANEYLGHVLQPPKGVFIGLKNPSWKPQSVTGNHDQWPGIAVIWGQPTAAFFQNTVGLPLVSMPMTLLGGVSIRFIRINSDADVSPFGYNRALARGSFCSELSKAAAQLGNPDPNEIRVLLIHHSYAHLGRKLRIESSSRKALEVFLVEQDIAVMLTGHTHVPHIRQFEVSHNATKLKVLEARSGTTTQTDFVPYHWRNLFGRRPTRTFPPNTLIVHRLYADDNDGRITWRATTYRRAPYGFVKADPEETVQVWPRVGPQQP